MIRLIVTTSMILAGAAIPSPLVAQLPPWPWENTKSKPAQPTNTRDAVPAAPRYGVVLQGDTLATIAIRYGLTMSEIIKYNPHLDITSLVPGDQISLSDASSLRKRLDQLEQKNEQIIERLRIEQEARDRELYSCDPKLFISRNAVTLLYSGLVTLRRHLVSSPNQCYDSQVRLFCFNGSCGVYFDSGKHGYHPLRCNAVRISQKIWRWCGNQPDAIAFEMCPHLDEGVEVATDLKLWPDGFTNKREYPVQLKRAKVLAYNASLGIASTP